MKVRYAKRGGHFIPEYLNKDNEWLEIKEKDIKNSDILWSIAVRLAELDHGGRWSTGVGYSDTKVLFYKSPVACCAFLGALQEYYHVDTKELSLSGGKE